MLKVSLMIMMTISVMMSKLQTPLSMGCLLLIQTILTCIITRFLTMSSWIPLTMFLVMVSGLMIIFTYVTSICSNNKFKLLNFNPTISIIFISSIIFMFNFYFHNFDNYQLKDMFNNEFIELYTPMNIFSSLFMFIYLLIILIIMINMLYNNKGPLRKKY
uniref:NADH dehydrogenase subunit 6 n=1 Tax=Trioza anthrisci TaxID=2023874 RepID=A0A344A2T3_9HEMI|nr:NADH dehydrogenase subunit 6 [Trioza anthrisci]AWU49074.1 NADH dehydrogenase subunit 6 [Trioza anthrisci]